MTDRRAWRRAVACAPSAHAHALSASGADLRAAGQRPAPCSGTWLCIAILGVAAAGIGLIAGTHALLLIGPVFLGAIVTGLAGFAFSAVAASLLLHWLSPQETVSLLLACSITIQAFSLAHLWRRLDWSACLPFLAGGLAGLPLGTELLRAADPRLYAGCFGGFLVAYAAIMLLRPHRAVRGFGRAGDAAIGFLGGIAGGAMAFPGAVPTMWCTLQGMPKHAQRSVVQPFILVLQLTAFAYDAQLGIVSSATLRTYLLCAPAILCGTWLGLHLFERIDDAQFRRAVLILLLVSGAVLMV
jgi:uncharacterized membrane protein YfcA